MSSSSSRLAFEDVVPVKLALFHFAGLSLLALLSPSTGRDLLEYALLTTFMLSWIYASVTIAANGLISLLTIVIFAGGCSNAAYIYYRWIIRNSCNTWQSELAFYNAILQALVSCGPAAYMLCRSWYRKLHGLELLPNGAGKNTTESSYSAPEKDTKSIK